MVTLLGNTEGYNFGAFTITHICQPAGAIECLLPDEHSIIINLGEPVNMTWNTDAPVTVARCSTHQIALLRPAHSFVEASCDDQFEYLYVSIDPSRAEGRLGTSQPFALRTNLDDSYLAALLLRLHEVSKDIGPGESLFAESLFTCLLLHLNSRYPGSHGYVRGKMSSSLLLQITEYVHGKLQENITVEQLCSLVKLSRYHFTRLFKATIGTTPHRYILQSKIEHAKAIMKKRKGSILDAAYQLSFSDHAHFTNTFRKFTGITPKSFLLNN
jgi:AraC family transcriptional regulator